MFKHSVVVRFQRSIAFCLLLLMAIPTPSMASIVVDAGSSASVDMAQNGVDVVNIEAPSTAGISKNTFNDYNVQTSGVIINNSTDIDVSDLGGVMYSNPNFEAEGRAADVVFFEVNGGNKSSIEGYTEMFGQSADFVLANPAGIYVNGAGFINIPRVTLTTGEWSPEDYSIRVGSGIVEIGQLGLYTQDQSAVDIWARAIEVNGALWGGDDLQIVAGDNTFDYSSRTLKEIHAASGDDVEFGIDASALGAMYAGRIYLMSTEDGVGIKLDGDLEAQQGNLVLQSNGDIELSSAKAVGEVSVQAKGDIAQEGAIYSETADVSIVSEEGSVDLVDSTIEAGTLSVESKTGTSIESSSAHLESLVLTSEGDIVIADNFVNAETVEITSQGRAELSSEVESTEVTVEAETFYQDDDLTADTIQVEADDIEFAGNSVLDSMTMTSKVFLLTGRLDTETIDITATDVQLNGTLYATQLNGQSDTILLDGYVETNALVLSATDVDIQGELYTESLEVDSVVFVSDGYINAGSVEVNASDIGLGGTLYATTLELSALDIDLVGALSSEKVVIETDTLAFSGYLDALSIELNSRETRLNGIVSSERLIIDTELFLNSGEVLNSELTVVSSVFQNSGAFTFNNGRLYASEFENLGDLLGYEGLMIESDTVLNNGFISASLVSVVSDVFENAGSVIAHELGVQSSVVVNDGVFSAESLMKFLSDDVVNYGEMYTALLGVQSESFETYGEIHAQSALIQADDVVNAGGIEAFIELEIESESFAQLGYLNSTDFRVDSTVFINTGDMHAGEAWLAFQRLDHLGGLYVSEFLVAEGETLITGEASEMVVMGLISFAVDAVVNNGTIATYHNFYSVSPVFNNAGALYANDVIIDAQSVDNQGLISARTLDLEAEEASNTGTLATDDDLLVTTTLFENKGAIDSVGDVELNSGTFVHTGTLRTDGVVDINGESIELNGNVKAGSSVVLNASSVDLLGDSEFGSLVLNTDILTLASDVVVYGDTVLNIGERIDVSGLLSGHSEVWVSAPEIKIDEDGTIEGNAVALVATNLEVYGFLYGLDSVELTLDSLYGSGEIRSDALTILADDVAWDGVLVGVETVSMTGDDLELNGDVLAGHFYGDFVGDIDLNGSLYSASQLTLSGDEILVNGSVESQGDLDVVSRIWINRGDVLSFATISLAATRAREYGTISSLGDINYDVVYGLGVVGDMLSNSDITIASSELWLTSSFVRALGTMSLTLDDSLSVSDSDVIGQERLDIIGGDITLSGLVYSAGDVTITGRDSWFDAEIDGDVVTIMSDEDLFLEASDVYATTLVLNAGGRLDLENSYLDAWETMSLGYGSLYAVGSTGIANDIDLSGDDITSLENAVFVSESDVDVVSSRVLLDASSQLQANQDVLITLSSESELVNSGALSAAGWVDINAATLRNTSSGRIESLANMKLYVDNLNNSGSINSGMYLTQSDGSQTQYGGLLRVRGTDGESMAVFTNTGTIQNVGNFNSVIETVENSGDWYVGQTLLLPGLSSLSNENGEIVANSISWSGFSSINNTNGLIQSNTGLTLSSAAGSYTGQGGSLIALSDMILTLASLDNANTESDTEGVLAAGNLTLTIDDIHNDDGRIKSAKTVLLDSDDISNVSGELSAGDDLNTTSTLAQLNNTNGVFKGQNIDVTITSLDNDYGTIKASSVADIMASTIWNRYTSDDEGIQAGFKVVLDAGTVFNDYGTIFSDESSQFSVSATQLYNRYGSIESNGIGTMEIGYIDNQNGVISAEDGLIFDGTEVDNDVGEILSDGSITLEASYRVTNFDGMISAGGHLDIERLDNTYGVVEGDQISVRLYGGDFFNEGGTVRVFGNQSLSLLGASDINNVDGKLESMGGIDLETSEAYLIEGIIFADGDVVISAPSIRNEGQLEASGVINLTTTIGDFENTLAGTISAPSLIRITSARDILNYGVLGTLETGSETDGVYLTADTVLNVGQVVSARDLYITADTIRNAADKLLFSNHNMVLAAGTIENIEGSILSLGNFESKGNGTALSSLFSNQSGSVQANGDILIQATEIENKLTYLEIEKVDLLDYYKAAGDEMGFHKKFDESDRDHFLLEYKIQAEEDLAGHDHDFYVNRLDIDTYDDIFGTLYIAVDGRERYGENGLDTYHGHDLVRRHIPRYFYRADASAPSKIQADGNITIIGDTLTNQASSITTPQDITIQTSHVVNEGYSFTYMESYSGLRNPFAAYYSFEDNPYPTLLDRQNSFDDYDVLYEAGLVFSNQTPKNNEFFGIYEDHYSNLIAEVGSLPATILAGGALDMDAEETFVNTGYSIELDDHSYDMTSIENDEYISDLVGNDDDTSLSDVKPEFSSTEIQRTGTIETLTFVDIPQGDFGLFKVNPDLVDEALESAAQAKDSDTDVDLSDTLSAESGDTVIEIGKTTLAGSTVVVAKTDSVIDDVVSESKHRKDVVVVQSGPLELTELVDVGYESEETEESAKDFQRLVKPDKINAERISIVSEVSLFSTPPERDYLIETNVDFIDVDSFKGSEYFLDRIGFDDDAILLGDAYFETNLVQDAIINSTGMQFLGEATNKVDLMTELYDNAAVAYEDLELSVGVALTKEQIKALTSDIVWLVEEEVEGVRVLVPKVYLSQLTIDNIDVDAGAIISGDTVEIDVADGGFYNSGAVKGDSNVDITAKDDVENNGGIVESGGDMSVTSLEGDIVNKAQVETTVDGDDIFTKLGRKGRFSSVGNMALDANGDVVVEGSDVMVGGNLDINAGGDVVFKTTEVRNRSNRSGGGRSTYRDTTFHSASSVMVGGDASIDAGGNVDVIGSDVAIAGRGDINAGDSVNIFGVENTTHEIRQTNESSDGFMTKTTKTTYDEIYKSTVRKGSLSFGQEDSSITAVEDVNFVGGDLDVAGQVVDLDEDGVDQSAFTIKAKDVNVVAMEDEYYEKHESKSSTSLNLNGWDKLLDITGVTALVDGLTGGLIADGMVLDGEGSGSETSKTTAVASEIAIEGDANIEAESMVMVGSDAAINGDLDLDLENDLLMLSKEQVERTSTFKEKTKLEGSDIKVDRLRLSAETSLTYGTERVEETTTVTTYKGSSFSVGGDMDADIGGNLHMEGSAIVAEGDVDVNAVGGITAKEVKAKVETETKRTDQRLTTTAKVGNSWADTAHSLKDSVEMLDKANQAMGELDNSESKISAAAAALMTTLVVAQTAKTANDIANSAQTAGTLGFYAAMSNEVSSETETTTQVNEYAIGSVIQSKAGDVKLETEGEMLIQGSTLQSDNGDVVLKGDGDKISITAAEEHNSHKTTYSKHSMTNTVTSAGSSLPTYTDAESSSKGTSVGQVLSKVRAENGTFKIINTTGEADLSGVDAVANVVDMTEVKDINLSSAQDRSEDKSNSQSISVGDTMGFSISESEASMHETTQQTRLVGTQEVLVEADSLSIDGAILANAEVNEDGTLGEDLGNMAIDVAELNITDQKNKEESWSEGFSFSTSMGGNFEQGGKIGLKPGEGSTAIGANNSGHKKEGIAYGTLGKTRSLTVAGEEVADDSEILAGVNRDISETIVVTEESTSGGLDVDLTISNAYLGKGGLTNLKNDLSLVDDLVYTKESGWGGNTKQAAVNVKDAGLGLGESIISNLTGNGDDGIIQDYKSNIRNLELGLQTRMDNDLKDAIKNMAENPEQAEAQIEKVAQMAAAANGVEGAVDIEFYNDPNLEAGGHKDGKIYINLAHQDGTSGTLMESLGDELSHYVDYKKGRPNSNEDSRRGDISTASGNEARAKALKNNSEIATLEEFNEFQQTASQHDFSDTNTVVATTEDMEHRTLLYSRPLDLPEIGGVNVDEAARHLFLVVDNSNYSDDNTSRIISLDGNMNGEAPEINTVDGFENDRLSLENGAATLEQIIDTPEGQTEEGFDNTIIENANSYDVKADKNSYPRTGVMHLNPLAPEARNSNTYVDDVVEESGGTIMDVDKAFKQNSWEGYQNSVIERMKAQGSSQENIDETLRRMRGFEGR